MKTGTKQRQAAKAFVRDWSGKEYEKGETKPFIVFFYYSFNLFRD